MAFKDYINNIQNAVYGEEVRSSIINALNKVNDDNESYEQTKQDIKNVKEDLENSKNMLNDIKNSTTSATIMKTKLDESIQNASTQKTELDKSISSSATSKENLDSSITKANTAKTNLDKSITSATTSKTSLDSSIDNASNAKTALDTSNTTSTQTLNSLKTEDTTAKSNIVQLQSENFKSNEILNGVSDIKSYLGLVDSQVVGVQVDYQNKTFKRLAGAVGLNAGTDFDKFTMFGDRKRCNVADDGTINAYYGDAEYKEDGSNGQVMVYQPKFYYRVVPVVSDPITTTNKGYHLRKANYYVSSVPKPNFKVHPAFFDKNGKETNYILISAYEGSIYDVSASKYLLNDEQVGDFSNDKLCSIAGARPSTGYSHNLTRPNTEQFAKNRGDGWHELNVKIASMEQLLMTIEYGNMNFQNAIGQGVVNVPWTTGTDTTSSYAGVTGSTASLGNGTGRATKTTTYEGGKATDYTVDGKSSISYRGVENFWGNLWKFVSGINIWGNGKLDGGEPYICKDFNYTESKNTDNYEAVGFTVTPKEGYISAMGYSELFDWLFVASETNGNSALPVGDYQYLTQNLNGYRIPLLGGGWYSGSKAGAFCWALNDGVGVRTRYIGGRLSYVPTMN